MTIWGGIQADDFINNNNIKEIPGLRAQMQKKNSNYGQTVCIFLIIRRFSVLMQK